MKITFRLFLGTFALLLLGSCEQAIRIDKHDFQSKPMVWALLTPDSLPRVFISQNLPLEGWLETDIRNQFIEGLSPQFSDGSSTETLTEKSGQEVEYQSFWQGGKDSADLVWYEGSQTVKNNQFYQLRFEWEEKEYFAQTTIPTSPEIVSAEAMNIVYSIGNSSWTEEIIRVVFTDNAAENSTYRVRLTQRGMTYFPVFDPVTSEYLGEDSLYGVFHSYSSVILDERLQGKEINIDIYPPSHGMRLKQGTNPDGSTFYYREYEVILETLDMATGKYLLSLDEQSANRYDPLAEPVFLKSNVENGQGIFGSRSLSQPYIVRVIN
ncbi:MAG: DUF4249 family protein [Bacteroidia bacterium]|nr:DUF4249 family protein [Bacteroidia bacterium]